MKKRKRRKAYEKGFSLEELIVAMAILAIFLSIAVPLYKGHIERANQVVCNVNCVQLERMYHVTYLMNFYKVIRKTYVLLMEISNMKTAKFDVYCIQKMKLMEMEAMKMMEAFLFCKTKYSRRMRDLRCL